MNVIKLLLATVLIGVSFYLLSKQFFVWLVLGIVALASGIIIGVDAFTHTA